MGTFCLSVARRLADSSDPTVRWLGMAAAKELTAHSVIQRIGGKPP